MLGPSRAPLRRRSLSPAAGRRAAATIAALALATGGCAGGDGESDGTTAASTAGTTSGGSSGESSEVTTSSGGGTETGAGPTTAGTSSGAETSTSGETTAGTVGATTDGTAGATTDGTAGGSTDGATTGGLDVLPSPGCGLAAEGGHFAGLTTLVEGVERSYDMFVPTPYDADEPHAVIFSYHGAGGTANTDQFRLDQNSTANDGFSINVAPQGWPSQEWDTNHFVPFNLEASVQVFDQVLDELAAERCVDLNRVFVIGHSNGGQMAFHLGCLRGDRVRAIFPSGGRCFSYGPGLCDPYHGPNSQLCSGPVKVMSVMGELDVTRHADEEATLAGFRARQGCDAVSEPVEPSPCLEFQGCNPGEEVASCRIPELAHALWKPGFEPLYEVMMSL